MAKSKDANGAISKTVKQRVRDADPNELRCLIENCPHARAVEFCHVVPTKDDLNTDSIEWFWKMRNQTIDWNDYRNIFLAGASFHVLHDEDRWALLPPQEIVSQYIAALIQVGTHKLAKRETFPDIPDGVFNYRFLPLRDMQNIAIIRQTEIPPTPNSFVTYIYPFGTLPELRSHVHPKYAILELGRKLSEMPPEVLKLHLDASPLLDDIVTLFRAWTARIPHDAWADESYTPMGSENDDDEDDPGMDVDGEEERRSASRQPDSSRRAQKRPTPSNFGPSSPPNRVREGVAGPSMLQASQSPNDDNKPIVEELNPEALAKKPEPQRYHDWLKKTFVPKADEEIDQVKVWNMYKQAFAPYADASPLLPASDVIMKASNVFGQVKGAVVRGAVVKGAVVPERFILRGLAVRES